MTIGYGPNLGGHQVFTASYKEWEGLKNGKLLEAAEDGSFEVLVTGDQTLCYEQNLPSLKLAVVALSTVECASSRIACRGSTSDDR